MDRTERIGLGVALAGHVVLFGLLSLGLLRSSDPTPPKARPIEVSLVDAVALDASAPPAAEPPAQSQAPEQGPPEEAAPPAPAPDVAPEPTPPAPQPKAAPAPAPKPAPQAPAPIKKQPVAKPEKAKTPPTKAAAAPPTKLAANTKAAGASPTGRRPRASGSILNDDFRKGLSASPSTSQAPTPPGATMNAKAAADIGSAILRQVQPCADRQTNPGPGAERIRVTIRLKLNRDGSLAARPAVTAHDGVDDGNSRYVDAVDRNAIATFSGCSPLRGLPTDLYDVPRGWNTFSLRYKLPG